jgi:hypothetical protein
MLKDDQVQPRARGSQTLRKLLLSSIAALMLAGITTSIATSKELSGKEDDDERDERGAYAIGLWGDLPYSDLQATTGVPNLIADMNRQDLEFTVHDGDLKVGSGVPGSTTPTTCSDAMYVQALGYLSALKAPAMFTPGDNDWTDRDRPANGGFSSLERLDHERTLFFSTLFSFGQHRMRQDVQTAALCRGVSGLVPCVENRRWTVRGVTYVTLNIPGSCNNLCDVAPDFAEYSARNEANIVWMQDAFAEAIDRHSAGVMVIAQANPGWDLTDGTRAPLRNPRTLFQTDGQPEGFEEFLSALRAQVIAFRRPVAYVHGDSHYFRIDRPFLDEQGRRLENFTRIETFGDNQANGNNDVHWLKVLVSPRTREVFSYEPQIVPANRTAVPAP